MIPGMHAWNECTKREYAKDVPTRSAHWRPRPPRPPWRRSAEPLPSAPCCAAGAARPCRCHFELLVPLALQASGLAASCHYAGTARSSCTKSGTVSQCVRLQLQHCLRSNFTVDTDSFGIWYLVFGICERSLRCGIMHQRLLERQCCLTHHSLAAFESCPISTSTCCRLARFLAFQFQR